MGERRSQCDCWRVERLTDALAGVSLLKLRCGGPYGWVFNNYILQQETMEYSPGFVCPTVFNPQLGNMQRGRKEKQTK